MGAIYASIAPMQSDHILHAKFQITQNGNFAHHFAILNTVVTFPHEVENAQTAKCLTSDIHHLHF